MADIIEGDWKSFAFKLIQPSDHPRVIEHCIQHLFQCLVCLGYDPSNKKEVEDWAELFKELLNDGNNLHFMALDKETGTVAGIRIISIVKKEDGEPEVPFKQKKSIIIFKKLVGLSDSCEIFEKYPELEKYADFFGTSVNPDYRQQGLCKEMYRRAILWCKAKGYSLAKVCFSSPYSRKAGKTNGFIELGRLYITNFTYEDGTPLAPTVDPKWYVDMGVFEF